MTIVYQRTQNRLTCIWSAMRAVPCLGTLNQQGIWAVLPGHGCICECIDSPRCKR
jgi:hypothetical protein